MPKRKPVVQYATLDVLLMILLYNAKKAVQIPAEVFKKHSLFFANHHTVSVSVQRSDNESIHTSMIVLKCTDKSKLRRLIEKYLSLYRKNKVSSTEPVLGAAKTDAVFARFFFLQSCRHRKTTLEFTSTSKDGSSSIARVYSLDTASFVMKCSYNGFPVTNMLAVSPQGKARIVVEIDVSALWENVKIHNPTGWRVRLNSPCASYQGHQIQFDKSTDKQKKLLDMLVSSKNGVLDTDKVISALKIDNTDRKGNKDREFALERIRELGREIRKKVNKQCKKDGNGQPHFRIEVGNKHIKLVDTSPV